MCGSCLYILISFTCSKTEVVGLEASQAAEDMQHGTGREVPWQAVGDIVDEEGLLEAGDSERR